MRNILFLIFLTGTTQPVLLHAETNDVVVTLERCLEMSFQKSPDFTRAQGNREMATADLRATTAVLLPKVTVSTGYARSNNSALSNYASYGSLGAGGLTGFPSSAASNQYTTSLNVNQTLLDIGAWKDVSRSSYRNQAAGWTYQDAVSELSLRVKQAYFQVVRFQAALQAARASVLQSEQQDTVARGMAHVGALNRNELLKVEVRLNQARIQSLTAENNLLNSRQALGLLIGVPQLVYADTTLVEEAFSPLPAEDSLIAEALEFNPACHSALLALDAAHDGTSAARFRNYPTVSGTYSYGYSDAKEVSGVTDWENHDYWSVGVNLNWPLFDGGRNHAASIQAKAQSRTAEADLFQARQSAINDLRQALGELRTAQEGLQLVDQLLPQAEEDYRLVRRKFELGSASALDLVTSQTSYDQAEEQRINVLCDYRIARAKIQRILGK